MKAFFTSILLFTIICISYSQGDNLRFHYQHKHPDYETFNDIWGWNDSLNNRQYAIIGSYEGFLVYDVTDVDDVNLVAEEYGKAHLDFKTYESYLYSNRGEVYNMSNLPSSIDFEYEYERYFFHNIWISDNLLFDDQLNYYDLSDPLNPIKDIVNGGIGGVHDGLVHDSLLITFSGWGDIADIYNLKDTTSPLIATIEKDTNLIYYSHSGIVHNNYLYISDEFSTRISVFDISNIDSLQFINHFEYNGSSAPHNLWIKNDLMYVSYYSAGLVVYDLNSDPINPDVVAYFDTFYGNPSGFRGAFGVYVFEDYNKILVSDMQNGLFVFSLDESAYYDDPFINVEEKIESDIELDVFPNPFNNEITISISENINKSTIIRVYDILGKEVVTKTIQNNATTIQLDNMEKGIYILDVEGVGKTKIIKN